jgi:hypothetical protein
MDDDINVVHYMESQWLPLIVITYKV